MVEKLVGGHFCPLLPSWIGLNNYSRIDLDEGRSSHSYMIYRVNLRILETFQEILRDEE